MDTFEPYDPEDMETLMREKSFDQLLPEEQAFVLKHIRSKEEYESLRRLYFQLHRQKAAAIEPSDELTARVMSEFRAKHAVQKRAFSWWNWLFARTPWFIPRNPGIRLAFATILLLVVALPFILENDKMDLLAENKQTTDAKRPVNPEDSAGDSPESAEGASVSEAIPQTIIQDEVAEDVTETIAPQPAVAEKLEVLARKAEEDVAEVQTTENVSRSEDLYLSNPSQAGAVAVVTDSQKAVSKEKSKDLNSLAEMKKSNKAGVNANDAPQAASAESESMIAKIPESSARKFESLLKKCVITR